MATAWSIWSGLKGLTTHALAPAALPSFILASEHSVVSMMTGVNLYSGLAFRAFTKVIPSIFGMFTSDMTKLIFWPSAFTRPSWPSTASTTEYPAFRKAIPATCRTLLESSTIMITFPISNPLCALCKNNYRHKIDIINILYIFYFNYTNDIPKLSFSKVSCG